MRNKSVNLRAGCISFGENKLSNNKNNETDLENTDIDLHKAAVVNENGEEVAITEDMIQEAIDQLDSDTQTETQSQAK